MNLWQKKYMVRALTSRYLYAWVPYLRYVGLNGSVARGEASKSSDIDIMIVSEPGHIFTVRFIVVGILAIFGLKRSQHRITGKICANYFITSDNLDIKPHNKKVAGWHKYMVALVDHNISNLKSQISKLHLKSQNFHNLIKEKNQWMGKYRVTIDKDQLHINQSIKPIGEEWATVRTFFEILLLPIADALEIVLKIIQIYKIKRHPLTSINPQKIIVNDKELMFHPKKHR